MPEHRINGGLIPLSMTAKEAEDVGIETQRNLLLLARPANGVFEKVGAKFRDFRQVDFGVSERVNSFPVRLGWPFRIVYVHDELPFSAK